MISAWEEHWWILGIGSQKVSTVDPVTRRWVSLSGVQVDHWRLRQRADRWVLEWKTDEEQTNSQVNNPEGA